jgi:SAM-dependent methyltransferase
MTAVLATAPDPTAALQSRLAGQPHFLSVCLELLRVWPQHHAFVEKSVNERSPELLAHTEVLAEMVVRIADSRLAAMCSGYRQMCAWFMEEELFFRRNGRYRASNYAEVEAAIYASRDIMTGYMHGLLLSQILWTNHTAVSLYFDEFLGRLPAGYQLLEIGPGHGLALYRALVHPSCGDACAWDVSEASLRLTRHALQKLGAGDAELDRRSIFDQTDERFDAVVCSEVLEHLEDPGAAVAALAKLMAPDGLAFINVPCNSPAPDHISLFRQPEEILTLLERNGLSVIDHRFFPATGLTLERARKAGMTMSCAAICRRQ